MKLQTRVMCRAIVCCLVTLLLQSALTDASTLRRVRLKGYCTGVPEPDLLEVWLGQHEGTTTVKLVGLDRESMEQAYPRYAHLVTRSYALDQQVRIEVVEKDEAGLITGRVIVEHEDLSFRLIAEGLARFDGMAPPSMRLHMAEDQAREAHRGLWAPDDDEEMQRQQEAAREMKLGDIAWQLDARRAAAAASNGNSGEEAVFEVSVGPGAQEEQRIEMNLGSWVGAPSSLVMAHWGEPARVEEGKDGGSVLVYERCGPGTEGAEGCRVLFFADDKGIIFHRAWESS